MHSASGAVNALLVHQRRDDYEATGSMVAPYVCVVLCLHVVAAGLLVASNAPWPMLAGFAGIALASPLFMAIVAVGNIVMPTRRDERVYNLLMTGVTAVAAMAVGVVQLWAAQ